MFSCSTCENNTKGVCEVKQVIITKELTKESKMKCRSYLIKFKPT